MLSFNEFIAEAKTQAPGIQHLEHPADRTFDGRKATHAAIKTLKGVVSSRIPITRKIDDKMSYQAVRTADGKVGVKYKGAGSSYNFSSAEVDKQHGHKPYLAEPLKLLHKHLGKVLPDRPGEYQGGYMSGREHRTTKGGNISHTPNTISYDTASSSPEGKKLARSHVSTVIHSELKGEHKTAHPITDTSEFKQHADVHQVQHVVSGQERQLGTADKKIINGHIKQAQRLIKGHSYHHLAGHTGTLRTHINNTIRTGEKPTVASYKAHLGKDYDKKIDAVKLEKTKEAKRADKAAALAHVDKNKARFDRTLDIHHHVQSATNHLASSIDSLGSGGFNTAIAGNKSEGEGFVGGGLKIVNRKGFSAANLAKSDSFKKTKGDM